LRNGRSGSDLFCGSRETRSEQAVTFLKVRIILIFIILIIPDKIWEVPRRTSSDATSFQSADLAFFSYFITAARAATCGAAGHFNFARCPVYLRVVLLEPRISEDEFLLPQPRDCEQGAFRVILVSQDEVDGFRDVTSLPIRGAINIPYWDGMRQCPSGQAVGFDIISINEATRRSRVD
jgi:hypothetical protein